MTFLQKILGIKLPTVDQINAMKEAQNQSQEPVVDAPLANIMFTLCRNGDIKIDCEWIAESPKLASAYGQFLYHINEGHLNQNIAQTLLSYAQKNICGADFINKVLEEWGKRQNDKENKPIVKPSQVIGMGKGDE